MEIKTAFGNLSIRKKLTLAYILTAVFILLVNIFVYINVNLVIDRLDRVYVTNINLNDLSNSVKEGYSTVKDRGFEMHPQMNLEVGKEVYNYLNSNGYSFDTFIVWKEDS